MGMRKRKRILCALLAAAMLMDVGSLPVGAAALGSDVRVASEVQNTEGSALQTEITPSEPITGEPIYSTEGSYAYYDADNHQVVWYNEAFVKNTVYTVSAGGYNSPVTANASRALIFKLSLAADENVQLTAVKDGDNTKYTVSVRGRVLGTKGAVKEYSSGKIQAEGLKEAPETRVSGKIIFVYGDASENALVLMKDSQGAAAVDLSEAKTIHHIVAVDYIKNSDGSYIFGSKRQLPYTAELSAVQSINTVAGDQEVMLTWNGVSGATQYIILQSVAGTNKWSQAGTTASTSYTCNKLYNGKQYYFMIRPVRTVGVYTQLGPHSKYGVAKPFALGQPQSVKAVAGDTQATVSWSKVANATGYTVKYSVVGSNIWVTAGTTAGTSYTCSNLTNGKKYYFMVQAVRTVGSYTQLGKNSKYGVAAPVMKKPTTPTSLTVTETSSGNKLTWKSSGKVTGFIVYSYDYDKSKYVKLATVKNATSYIHKGAKSTERYKYAVRAYRSEGSTYLESALAEKIIFGKKLVSSTNSTVHPLYYTAYMKKKIGMFKTQWETSSSKYIRVIKKGTKVTVIRLHPSKPKIRLSDGTEGYTYRGALRLSSELYTSKQYTKQQVECFVNQRTYTSNTKYLIWIATYPQTIYVFKGSKGNWTLVRSGRCATGAITTPDYPGEKKVSGKKRWHYYGKRFYQYLSILNDGNTIHTRPAYRKSGKYVDSRLGRPLSHGCIRVTDADGGYIYKNCGKGTKVVVY